MSVLRPTALFRSRAVALTAGLAFIGLVACSSSSNNRLTAAAARDPAARTRARAVMPGRAARVAPRRAPAAQRPERAGTGGAAAGASGTGGAAAGAGGHAGGRRRRAERAGATVAAAGAGGASGAAVARRGAERAARQPARPVQPEQAAQPAIDGGCGRRSRSTQIRASSLSRPAPSGPSFGPAGARTALRQTRSRRSRFCFSQAQARS